MRALPLLLVLVACGGDGTNAPDGPPGGADADPGDPFARPMGTILVAEQIGRWDGAPEPMSAVWVELVAGSHQPFHRETARTGECRLLEYQPANDCNACQGICTLDGCIPFPDHLDAGTPLAITGTAEPLSVTRDDYSGRYYSGILPVELFAPGDAITVAAPGGPEVPAFTLTAPAPAPLETAITSPHALPLADDATIAWTAGTGGDRVFLTITAANQGHGQPYPAIIECASADDGAITVPGAFVAELGTLSGFACLVGHECPPAVLTRYRRAATTTSAGGVELWVATERVFFVSHDPE